MKENDEEARTKYEVEHPDGVGPFESYERPWA